MEDKKPRILRTGRVLFEGPWGEKVEILENGLAMLFDKEGEKIKTIKFKNQKKAIEHYRTLGWSYLGSTRLGSKRSSKIPISEIKLSHLMRIHTKLKGILEKEGVAPDVNFMWELENLIGILVEEYKDFSKKRMSGMWKLESREQKFASYILGNLVEKAEKEEKLRKLLEHIFEEDWETIKKKVEEKGSTWYDWWVYGVNRFIGMHRDEEIKWEKIIKQF
ncbi:MAG: hypothetical protein DDT21_02698 [Syntrophomonadaceae bacterium]|nr:hypothetical protein [Bacillota bacterium]